MEKGKGEERKAKERKNRGEEGPRRGRTEERKERRRKGGKESKGEIFPSRTSDTCCSVLC